MIENNILVDNSLKLIQSSLKYELKQSLLYEHLIELSSDKEEKEIICSMSDCIKNHFCILKNIYIDFKKNNCKQEELSNFECPLNYTDCLKKTMQNEFEMVSVCKEIRNGFSQELYKELLFNIIVEKMNIVSHFNYLLTLSINKSSNHLNEHDIESCYRQSSKKCKFERAENLDKLEACINFKPRNDLAIRRIACDFIKDYFNYSNTTFSEEDISTFNSDNANIKFYEYSAVNNNRNFTIRILDKNNLAFFGKQEIKNSKNKPVNANQAKKIANSFLKNKEPELFKELLLMKEDCEIVEDTNCKQHIFEFSNSIESKGSLIKVDSSKGYISCFAIFTNDDFFN